MSVLINFDIIELRNTNIKIDYLYKLHNYYIAFSKNLIVFINLINKKIVNKFNYEINGRPYISPYNDKIILQYLNESNSYYDILNLHGKKLTNTSIKCKNNFFLISFKDILYTLTFLKNILYIFDPNDKIKIMIKLNFSIIWYSNPINYIVNNLEHIVILVKTNNNLYVILDIIDNITQITNEFTIDHNIINEQITIGFNNGLEMYMPSLEQIIIGKLPNLNFIHFISYQCINGNFINVKLVKNFKQTNSHSEILDNLELKTYHIDPFKWKENNI